MKELLQFFSATLQWSQGVKKSRATMVFSSVTGMIAGLGTAAFIVVINSALAGRSSAHTLLWQFFVLCALVPASGFVSHISLVRLATEAEYALRLRLSRQIIAMPYRMVEQLRTHRLLATLVDDIPAVTAAITSLPFFFMHVAIMVGCLCYLGWLSWQLLLALLGFMVVGIFTYQYPITKSLSNFRQMREQSDVMFRGVRALTEGTKELKLNRYRRAGFLAEEYEPALAELKRFGFRGQFYSKVADNWGWIQFFLFIGLVVFFAPHFVRISVKDLTGYSLTVLFMMTPLSMILTLIPIFGKAHVAANKTRALGLSLTAHPSDLVVGTPAINPEWQRLDLEGVTHAYWQDASPGEFYLGPIDLTLYPGDLVFVIGGNGSGKTTLAKILMGLYEPEKGVVKLDGKVITQDNRDDFRQRFSVVFSDFYLFDRLFGIDSSDIESKSGEYLRRLQLDQKLKIDKDRLSTIDLSQGQRKRLALLIAYLEDRPIYVFDEWASDQDPLFKRIFYLELLPALKARGKTVMVITHDDHYFHVADRVIKLDGGQIEYDRRIAGVSADMAVPT
jgi:putative ATP-binding cassette transporter